MAGTGQSYVLFPVDVELCWKTVREGSQWCAGVEDSDFAKCSFNGLIDYWKADVHIVLHGAFEMSGILQSCCLNRLATEF